MEPEFTVPKQHFIVKPGLSLCHLLTFRANRRHKEFNQEQSKRFPPWVLLLSHLTTIQLIIMSMLASFRKWLQRKQLQFEVTFAIYMFTPWEKFAFCMTRPPFPSSPSNAHFFDVV